MSTADETPNRGEIFTLLSNHRRRYTIHFCKQRGETERMEVYMDIVPGDSIPWGEYYLGLSIIGGMVLGGVWFDILPTETVPELGWAALVLGVFAASAGYHVYQSRQNRLGAMERPP